MSEPMQPNLDADGRVAEDLPCAKCRYSLRGLSPAGNCPECDLAIAKSIQAWREWVPRRWLILFIGATLVPVIQLVHFVLSLSDFELLGKTSRLPVDTVNAILLIVLSYADSSAKSSQLQYSNRNWFGRPHVFRGVLLFNLLILGTAWAIDLPTAYRKFFSTVSYIAWTDVVTALFFFYAFQVLKPPLLRYERITILMSIAIYAAARFYANTALMLFLAGKLEISAWPSILSQHCRTFSDVVGGFFLPFVLIGFAACEWHRQIKLR